MNTTSKQPMLTNMIERRILQEVEPVARADADALKAIILVELAKIGVREHSTNLYGFIDEVGTHRLNMLVEARTAAVAERMIASSEPADIGAAAAACANPDVGLSESLGDAPAAPTFQSSKIGEGDALLVTTANHLSADQRDKLRAHIRAEMGANIRILIADGGTTIAAMDVPAAAAE